VHSVTIGDGSGISKIQPEVEGPNFNKLQASSSKRLTK